MKRKITTLLLAFVMALMSLPMTTVSVFAEENAEPTTQWKDFAAEDYAGGTGTEDDPYLIATEAQLAKISVEVAGAPGTTANKYKNQFFKLMNDLDLSAHRWNPIGQYKWLSDGSSITNYFCGNFDGNGKTIRGLYVDEEKDGFAGGLFGAVAIYAGDKFQLKICNLTIKDAKIYGNRNDGLTNGYNGILASNLMGNSSMGRIIVENVHVSGVIEIADETEETSAPYSVGGMSGGIDYADFSDCSVDYIEIKGNVDNSGGFVGVSGTSTYTDCLVRGTMSGRWATGGFVGYAAYGNTYNKFSRCVANVDITAIDWNVGGFCGYSNCNVEFTNCAAFGNVESKVTGWSPRVSGFVGYINNMDEDTYLPLNSVLTNCYFGGTLKSAHSEISPSAIAAVSDETVVIKNCIYDSGKNSNLNAFSDGDGAVVASYTATALSGDTFLNTLCNQLYGHHSYEGNTCKICGLEMVYVNKDGYWVIDGKTTDIKAVGENGVSGVDGKDGVDGTDGKNATNGLAIAAMITGGAALACNIAFVVYSLIKKKYAKSE